MIDSICLLLTNKICRNLTEADVDGSGITLEDVHDLYMYRIQKNIRNYGMMIAAVIILIISAGIKAAAAGLIFMIAFAALRKYWGGLHIENPDICFMLSTAIVIAAVYTGYNINLQINQLMLISVISGLILNLKGVKDHINTPYTYKEKRELQVYGNYVLLVLMLVIYGTRSIQPISNILTLGIVSETVIIVLTNQTYVR